MSIGSHLLGSISEISQQLEKGILTTSQLFKKCSQRIEDTKNLNAFITVDNAASEKVDLAQQRITKRQKLHALDGIPVAVKDNFNTAGIKTTCASKMLSKYVPPYNASVVQRLLDCGAIVIGKTNMDEFAMGSGTVDSFFGPVKNPWRSGLKYKLYKRSQQKYLEETSEIPNSEISNDDFFVCGGSSGGSAVAVATGCCFGALSSDTGGSTRSPAAMCGIVGLKPTYGLVSRHGLIPLCNSLDVPGILTKTVDDAATLLGTVSGWDPQDSTTCRNAFKSFNLPNDVNVKGLHVGIPKEYLCPGMSSETSELWNFVADLLEREGAKVSYVSLPHTKYSIVCYSVLCCCDVASNFARYDGIKFGHRSEVEKSVEHLFAATRHEGFGEVVRGRILTGNYFLLKKNYEKYFVKAAQVRRLICNDFHNVFNSGIDILLTPVTLSDSVPYSEWIQKSNREHNAFDDFCTQPVNLAGLPAISIPCKLSKKGLPLGLQLIGQSFQEKTMLIAAKLLEQELDFPQLDFDIKDYDSNRISLKT